MGGSYRKAEALGHFTALLPWHWPIGMIFQQKLPGIARVPPRSCSPGVDGCLSNSFALFLQYINNTYIYIYIHTIYIYIYIYIHMCSHDIFPRWIHPNSPSCDFIASAKRSDVPPPPSGSVPFWASAIATAKECQ